MSSASANATPGAATPHAALPSPLLLSYEYPPRVYGGLGQHVAGLAAALSRTGVSVHVATLGPSRGEPDDDKVAVHRTVAIPVVGSGADWLSSLLAFDTVLGLAAAQAGNDVDVVHAHDWLVARTAVAASRRMPLVVTVHATERGRHQGWLPGAVSRFIDGVEQWLAHAADRVIVCSNAMRGLVIRHWGVDPDRITVVPNAVRRDFKPRDPQANTVLFAGRLEHEKGGQILLAAVRALADRGVVARVVFAGAGSQRDTWAALAEDLGVDRQVAFLGHLSWDDLTMQYARAAVVAVPSLYEPFGMVAAEALAAGAPVVAADVDGLPEALAGAGPLVPPHDAAALADALSALLTSPRQVRKAEVAAQRRASTLPTWADAARGTLAVYEQAMDRSRTWTG